MLWCCQRCFFLNIQLASVRLVLDIKFFFTALSAENVTTFCFITKSATKVTIPMCALHLKLMAYHWKVHLGLVKTVSWQKEKKKRNFQPVRVWEMCIVHYEESGFTSRHSSPLYWKIFVIKPVNLYWTHSTSVLATIHSVCTEKLHSA